MLLLLLLLLLLCCEVSRLLPTRAYSWTASSTPPYTSLLLLLPWHLCQGVAHSCGPHKWLLLLLPARVRCWWRGVTLLDAYHRWRRQQLMGPRNYASTKLLQPRLLALLILLLLLLLPASCCCRSWKQFILLS
jgi:hypothetical protein